LCEAFRQQYSSAKKIAPASVKSGGIIILRRSSYATE